VCTNTEIDSGSMEDIESGLHAVVQFGKIIERLLVSFAVHVFDNTRVHYMCRITPWRLVRIFFVFIVLIVNTHIILIKIYDGDFKRTVFIPTYLYVLHIDLIIMQQGIKNRFKFLYDLSAPPPY